MNGPGWAATVLVTLVLSTAVSLTALWAHDTGRLDMLWNGRRSAGPALQEGIEVPQVVGLHSRLAGEVLQARGLRWIEGKGAHDGEIPKGVVLSQRPDPNTRLTPGSAVTLTLALGPAQALVPEVTGLDADAARAALEEAGLAAGELLGDEPGEGVIVVGSSPGVGESAPPGTSVTLTLSRTSLSVPDVTGMPLRKAKEALKKAGLRVGELSSRFVDERPAWIILFQSPAAGSKVKPDSRVDLVWNEE